MLFHINTLLIQIEKRKNAKMHVIHIKKNARCKYERKYKKDEFDPQEKT